MTLVMTKTCENGESGCGEYYTCGRCKHERYVRIWRNMSEERKNYDRWVDPRGSAVLDRAVFGRSIGTTITESLHSGDYEAEGCSCHINPPCGYCETHCVDCDSHVDDCSCQ